MNSVDVSTLRALLTYDPDSGFLTWQNRSVDWFVDERSWKIWSTNFSGKTAGNLRPDGYVYVGVIGQQHKAHRLAWALHHGNWPVGYIDHINGACSDNRISNLRDVSHRENLKNQKRSSRNTSGITGVYWDPGKQMWRAQIFVSGKRNHLGYFPSLESAADARRLAERQMDFHKNHGKRC